MHLKWKTKEFILISHVLFLTFLPGTSILSITEVITNLFDHRCIEVKGDLAKIGVILNVLYPQYMVEAGRFISSEGDLKPGTHTLAFIHAITNMTHDLLLEVDGISKKLEKSLESRWYSISTFSDVTILSEGDVKLYNCSLETYLDLNNQIEMNLYTTLTSSPIASESTTSRNNIEDNETYIEEKKIQRYKKPIVSIIERIEDVRDTTEHINFNNLEDDDTLFNDSGNSFEDNVSAVSDNDCVGLKCGDGRYDGVITYTLIGGLLALVASAVLISLIFYRKKKKLSISDRERMRMRKISAENKKENETLMNIVT